jgi:four helix bundle protein
MQHFTELKVWQRAHKLVLALYRLTTTWPDHERFGVTSQIRRAAVSVPANIAEGAKRHRPQDYSRFLNIAESSLAETQYLLLLARDVEYVGTEDHDTLTAEMDELARMLYALRMKVEGAA